MKLFGGYIMKHLSVLLIVLFLPFSYSLSAKVKISGGEVKRVEAKIRTIYNIQRLEIINQLQFINKEFAKFLYGPQVGRKISKFYYDEIKNGSRLNDDQLWKKFQNQVLSKNDYLSFSDKMIDGLFRSVVKVERKVSLTLDRQGLEGLPKQNYDIEKDRIRQAIRKIWDMDTNQIQDLINNSSGNTNMSGGKIAKMGSAALGGGAAVGGALLLGPVGIAAIVVGLTVAAVASAWMIYDEIAVRESTDINYQDFKRKTNKVLEKMAVKIKKEFEISADNASNQILAAITKQIQAMYPEIQKVR
jgi:hypothetical protein